MKSWVRVLGLFAFLAVVDFSTADAWPWPEYGTCYLTCGEAQYSFQSTQQECCSGPHYCPDGSYATFAFWDSYYGSPEICTY